MSLLTREALNKQDLVAFLRTLGFEPQKKSTKFYWYRSMLPGPEESAVNFQVNRKDNTWIHLKTNQGGTLLDFGVLFFDCTIKELMTMLSAHFLATSSVTQRKALALAGTSKLVTIRQSRTLDTPGLIQWLWQRRIPLSVARKYCKEVTYSRGDANAYQAIGFPTDAGGYELIDRYHRYNSKPGGPTYLYHGSPDIAVFTNFMDMLTLVSLIHCPDDILPDLLVLNASKYFQGQVPLINAYRHKRLFFPHDQDSQVIVAKVLGQHKGYLDHSPLYKGYADLNDWACYVGKPILPRLSEWKTIPPGAKRRPLVQIPVTPVNGKMYK
jgi:hypothetical protein